MYTLSNGQLSVVVRPDLGGRIDYLTDLRTGKEWLWHPPDYAGLTRVLETGASFDTNWSGGWDEMFPNDAACSFDGRPLPDHGELWSSSWLQSSNVSSGTPLSLSLNHPCKTVPVNVGKTISLSPSSAELRIDYRFENLSDRKLPFLFKLHPALAIEAGDEIIMPEAMIEPVDLGFSTLVGQKGKTAFPIALSKAGTQISINQVRERDSVSREFLYATDLAQGWCGLKNRRTGMTLRLEFSLADFPYVWLFQSYGGWNNHYVLMLEPCTNVPYDLTQATAQGTCASLNPHEIRLMRILVKIQ
jgi:galactose mutarotase-like enzyme